MQKAKTKKGKFNRQKEKAKYTKKTHIKTVIILLQSWAIA